MFSCRSCAAITPRTRQRWISSIGTRSSKFTARKVSSLVLSRVTVPSNWRFVWFFFFAELPAESGHLPTFVDPAFQMTYYLNDTGIRIARRVLTIVSYSCPDITYAPSLYPITCILLHYMTGTWSVYFLLLLVVLLWPCSLTGPMRKVE